MDVLAASLLTGATVSSCYLWASPRNQAIQAFRDVVLAAAASKGSFGYFCRDDPLEIWKRSLSLIASAAGAVAATRIGILAEPPASVLQRASTVAWTLALTTTLWLGPLLESPRLFVDQFLVRSRRQVSLHTASAVRYLVIAPLTEEVIFRAAMFELLRSRSVTFRIAVAGALFAVAHVHLVVNMAVEECREILQEELAPSVPPSRLSLGERRHVARRAWSYASQHMGAQLALVAAYGWFNGWFFEKVCNSDVVAAAAAHGLCNLLGFPPFAFFRRADWSLGRRCAAAVGYVAGVVVFGVFASGLSIRVS